MPKKTGLLLFLVLVGATLLTASLLLSERDPDSESAWEQKIFSTSTPRPALSAEGWWDEMPTQPAALPTMPDLSLDSPQTPLAPTPTQFPTWTPLFDPEETATP